MLRNNTLYIPKANATVACAGYPGNGQGIHTYSAFRALGCVLSVCICVSCIMHGTLLHGMQGHIDACMHEHLDVWTHGGKDTCTSRHMFCDTSKYADACLPDYGFESHTQPYISVIPTGMTRQQRSERTCRALQRSLAGPSCCSRLPRRPRHPRHPRQPHAPFRAETLR